MLSPTQCRFCKMLAAEASKAWIAKRSVKKQRRGTSQHDEFCFHKGYPGEGPQPLRAQHRDLVDLAVYDRVSSQYRVRLQAALSQFALWLREQATLRDPEALVFYPNLLSCFELTGCSATALIRHCIDSLTRSMLFRTSALAFEEALGKCGISSPCGVN